MEYGYGYIHLCAEQRWKKTSVIKKSINAVKDENGHAVTNWMAKDDLLQWKYTVVLFILLILIIFYSFFFFLFLKNSKIHRDIYQCMMGHCPHESQRQGKWTI